MDGGGFLALKSHIICSSKTSCMETKAVIVCFYLNSVFLIDPKNDDCADEKNALPLNVGQLIFIPRIVCIWSYPMVSKHKTLLHSYRCEGRLKGVWQWKGYRDIKTSF